MRRAIVDGCCVDDGDAARGVGEDVLEVFDFVSGENKVFLVFEFDAVYLKSRCGDAEFGKVDECLGLLRWFAIGIGEVLSDGLKLVECG